MPLRRALAAHVPALELKRLARALGFVEEPALAESAVEELLRYTSPLETGTFRVAREDVKVGNATIPKDAVVLAVLAAANRDESRFPNPDTLDLARERAAVADDVDLQRHADGHRDEERGGHRAQDARIDEHARPEHVGPDAAAGEAVAQRVLRRVAHQALRQPGLRHDVVAGVDAGGAADALVLQPVPDVDASGADLDADAAVHAIALAESLAAGLAAIAVIRDDERVLVEHCALEARIGAHVLAHLLAHPAGVAIGGETVEEHPERLPRPRRRSEKFPYWSEVAYEGDAGPEREGDPGRVLRAFQEQFFR